MINFLKKININHFLLLISFICIVVMFVCNLPYQDELAYAYKSGLRSGSYNVLERIGSLMDIIAQQIEEYQCSGNGRVIIHGILAFFSAAKLNFLFRIISVLFWYILVYLILKNGKFEIKNSAGFLTGFLIVYWFLWYSETTCRDASYTINYLWCAVFFLACYGCWNSIKWWQVPLGFFLGASQETFALPALCALTSAIIIKLILRKKFPCNISLQKICFVVCVSVGVLFILLSPSGQGRANETIGSIFMDIIKSGINMFLYFGSIVLLICSFWILIYYRKNSFCFNGEFRMVVACTLLIRDGLYNWTSRGKSNDAYDDRMSHPYFSS